MAQTQRLDRPSTTPHPDVAKATALKRMKNIALGLLIFMAVVFCFAFALQQQFPWLAYVRAAAEGGMVGALRSEEHTSELQSL